MPVSPFAPPRDFMAVVRAAVDAASAARYEPTADHPLMRQARRDQARWRARLALQMLSRLPASFSSDTAYGGFVRHRLSDIVEGNN